MAHDNYAHSNDVGHVVGLPMLAGVLGVLLVLTFVTVAITWVDLGQFNLFIAMAIALVKATLVVLYFMHLRWARPFNTMIFLFSLVLVTLFIALALADSAAYQPNLIPGYSPGMQAP